MKTLFPCNLLSIKNKSFFCDKAIYPSLFIWNLNITYCPIKQALFAFLASLEKLSLTNFPRYDDMLQEFTREVISSFLLPLESYLSKLTPFRCHGQAWFHWRITKRTFGNEVPHAFKTSTRIIETSTRRISVYPSPAYKTNRNLEKARKSKMVVTVYFRIFDYFQISPTMNTGTVSAMIFASWLIILQFSPWR